MVVHCSLGDIKSPQVSKTLVSILADLNSILARPLISGFFSPCIDLLVTLPSAPVTIRIADFFMVPTVFDSQANIIIQSGRLAKTRSAVYISESPKTLCLFLQDGFWVVQIPIIIIIIIIIYIITTTTTSSTTTYPCQFLTTALIDGLSLTSE